MADSQQTQSIDPRERYHDEEESLRVAFEGMQAGLWTAMPVSVISYNPELQTISAQINVQAQQRDQYGKITLLTIKPLLDCPVMFPTGGGFTLTFPINAGDEGLIIFASRCIDNWYQNGGVQPPYELHMHDLSDGFYLPGCRSNPRALSSPSTLTCQLRSDDGETFVEIAAGGIVNISAPTEINLNTPIVNVQGVINVLNENSQTEPFIVQGNIQVVGDVVAGAGTSNISLLNHHHTGVQTGGGNTGGPAG